MYNIYLVEDEENLNNILKSYLEKEGWNVKSFLNGVDAQKNIKNRPDLWILDIMLPDIDGYQLIKEIKNDCENIPVIFISARDEDLDRVIGLEMGSDDYLSKPFLPRELVIRTKKLLNRVYKNSNKIPDNSLKSFGVYKIDEEKRMVKLYDNIIDLTSKEFDLLVLFINNQGKAFSRENILDSIWGEDYFGNDRVVDDLVRRLRKKMPKLNIETIYGFGYRMVIM
ncbi:transcriptional regulatory protein CssR [Clostridium tepidiprofundi DSM 19306]|uniref:Stage 0 sporulation protein A homolog n=1 Tax=Clostridium tepidiprofundi DSM 19306 TaxID=1121338 RepID=A0A151B695_9CLOT|nr:response regulator transcription factor [Clostridium tepidiprofundi]KYH35461.1 transcriptional regulatory protein CssR [Clostridium tepidiprofundi DSM 19306]